MRVSGSESKGRRGLPLVVQTTGDLVGDPQISCGVSMGKVG